MSREYSKKLTKQQLLDWGFIDIVPDNSEFGYTIKRLWFKNSSKSKIEKTIKISLATCHHKYTADKNYPKVTFCVKSKGYSIPLSRIIYTWFVEDIKDGYVIDHIDNNPFNNNVYNLQMLTPEDNLRKRYQDNDTVAKNQYNFVKEF